MKEIITEEFLAKDGNKYKFELEFKTLDNGYEDNYTVKTFNESGEQVGHIDILNTNLEKFLKSIDNDPLFELKYIINESIGYTGLEIVDNNIKIIDREEYNEFCIDFLGSETVFNLKTEKGLSSFLEEVNYFISPQIKEAIKKSNRPKIGSVYVSDCDNEYENKLDLRGIGLGKMLYTYASQWLGANNLKLYTNDIRTQNALDIWKHFRGNEDFNYGKDEFGEFIYRKDGIILDNEITNILKLKEENNIKTRNKNKLK